MKFEEQFPSLWKHWLEVDVPMNNDEDMFKLKYSEWRITESCLDKGRVGTVLYEIAERIASLSFHDACRDFGTDIVKDARKELGFND